jgi:ankyrin repeat protein
MFAVKYENLNSVKFLVENGANINLKNNNGLSPLILAVKHSNLDIVKYLVE